MPDRVSRPLVLACAALLVLLAGHDLAHLLDDGLDTSAGQLALVATPQWIVLAAVMAAIVRCSRPRGAALALVLGVGASAGVLLVHLLPFAPAAYWDLSPSAASWALLWLPVVVAAVVAGLALRELRPGRPVPC